MTTYHGWKPGGPDIEAEDFGGLVLLVPKSRVGRAWLERHVRADWLGDSLPVPGYLVDDLLREATVWGGLSVWRRALTSP